jgi:hypothetical protein
VGSAGAGKTECERLEEMESRGLIKLGTGRIPEDFWGLSAPEDPRGAVLGALLDEREEDY